MGIKFDAIWRFQNQMECNNNELDLRKSKSQNISTASKTIIPYRILATSSDYTFNKRPYCEDYLPLSVSLNAKNIGLQIAKGGIVTFAMAMMEYNKVRLHLYINTYTITH